MLSSSAALRAKAKLAKVTNPQALNFPNDNKNPQQLKLLQMRNFRIRCFSIEIGAVNTVSGRRVPYFPAPLPAGYRPSPLASTVFFGSCFSFLLTKLGQVVGDCGAM